MRIVHGDPLCGRCSLTDLLFLTTLLVLLLKLLAPTLLADLHQSLTLLYINGCGGRDSCEDKEPAVSESLSTYRAHNMILQ